MSDERSLRLHVAAPPHIGAPESATHIMLWVIAALTPSALWAIWNMKMVAVVLFAASIISCVGTEWVWNAALKRKQTIGDMSALLTGMLLAMTLPPHTPWWIAAAGGIVAIALAKMLFGGLGWNLFNPALVGRSVALLSWLGVMAQVKPFAGGWHEALS
ncbi:MAG: Na+-transporting NADH:ubiquinone oxidoreductase subunit D, partial [Coriobacteriaceae bacterium]|nr:Na+-transporting NADH:ubiquinone oxidoreductase subunit D [Coriobacteriaceae bacterium]